MESRPSPIGIVYTALSVSDVRATLNPSQFRCTIKSQLLVQRNLRGHVLWGKTLNACLNHVPSYKVGRVENLLQECTHMGSEAKKAGQYKP